MQHGLRVKSLPLVRSVVFCFGCKRRGRRGEKYDFFFWQNGLCRSAAMFLSSFVFLSFCFSSVVFFCQGKEKLLKMLD